MGRVARCEHAAVEGGGRGGGGGRGTHLWGVVANEGSRCFFRSFVSGAHTFARFFDAHSRFVFPFHRPPPPTHTPCPPAPPPLHWPPWPLSPWRLARSWRPRPVIERGRVGGGRGGARRGAHARESLPPHRARLHPAPTPWQQRDRGTAHAPRASGMRGRIGRGGDENKNHGAPRALTPSGTPPPPPSTHSRRPAGRGQHRQPPGGRRPAGHGAAAHLQLRGDAEGGRGGRRERGVASARGARQNTHSQNTPLLPSPTG